MSPDDILATLGIEAAVASHPMLSTCSNEVPLGTTYPTGTVITLAAIASLTTTTLGYLMFRFRRISAQYLRDRFEYALSTRTDLRFRLVYEFCVGAEQHSCIEMEFAREPNPAILLDASLTPRDDAADETGLSEVVVE